MGDANLYRAMGNALTDGVDPTGKEEVKMPKPEVHAELITETRWVTVEKIIASPPRPGGSGMTLLKQELEVKESFVAQEYKYELVPAMQAAENKAKIIALTAQLNDYQRLLNAAQAKLQLIQRGTNYYGAMGFGLGVTTLACPAAAPSAFIARGIAFKGSFEVQAAQKEVDRLKDLIAETNKEIARLQGNLAIDKRKGKTTVVRETGWQKTGHFK